MNIDEIEFGRIICDRLGVKTEPIVFDHKNKEFDGLRQDYSTIALAKMFDVPYREILKKQLDLALEYEVANAGFRFITEDIIKEYASSFEVINIKIIDTISVAEFICTHETGRYLICIAGHIFAFIDGVIYDDPNNLECIDVCLRSVITQIYKIEV